MPKNTILVRPVGDLIVRRPAGEGGQLLKREGEAVPHNSYWDRRLLSKDVEIVKSLTVKSIAKKSKPSLKKGS